MKVDSGQIAVGSVVGLYRITRILDGARSGPLFEGQHMLLETRVLLRLVGPEVALTPHMIDRFIVEAKQAARIAHDNVAKVVDVGHGDDRHAYVVMELLEGGTLAAALREGPLAWPRAKHIALQVAAGLGAAHALSIVHGDVRPENVFLARLDEQADVVKLIGFGAGKVFLSAGLAVPATRSYLAPEQVEGGRPIDPRTDVYALGAVLYEMLTGGPMFTDRRAQAAPDRRLVDVPPPSVRRSDLGIPAAADAIVLRALEVDPARRWPDFETMIKAMEMIPDWPGAGIDIGPSEVTPMLPHASEDAWSGQIEREAVEAASHALAAPPPRAEAAPPPSGATDAPPDASSVPDLRKPRRWPVAVVIAGALGGAALLALSRSQQPGDATVAQAPPARPAAGPVVSPVPPAEAPPPPPSAGDEAEQPAGAHPASDRLHRAPRGSLSARAASESGGAGEPEGKRAAEAPAPPQEAAADGACTVTLGSRPGADVWIDGARVGATPIVARGVACGRHQLVFRDPDQGLEHEEAVVLVAGHPLKRSVDLTRPAGAALAEPCRITLGSNPWAEVSIDGRAVGSTPVVDHPVACGTHQILLRNPEQHLEWRQSVQVKPGEVFKRVVNLEPDPSP
jgi:serine/threonine-protein kinase